jgi:hypothetical protein
MGFGQSLLHLRGVCPVRVRRRPLRKADAQGACRRRPRETTAPIRQPPRAEGGQFQGCRSLIRLAQIKNLALDHPPSSRRLFSTAFQ